MFIELTTLDNNKVLINTNLLVNIYSTNKGPYVMETIVSTTKGIWEVKESYEEIKEMIFTEV